LWLLGYFVVITIGELYLSPIGLSLVSKVAPARMVSMLMGLWLAASFAGNPTAGWLCSLPGGMDHAAYFPMIPAIRPVPPALRRGRVSSGGRRAAGVGDPGLTHVPEKWAPVFRIEHAQNKAPRMTSVRSAPRVFDHVETWIFDLDNTLYPHHLNLWQQVDERIRDYIASYLKVTREEAFRV